MVASNQEQYKFLLRVSEEHARGRLDKLLSLLVPDMGLRGRRRLIETGKVLVDGRRRSSGYRVVMGQEVRILPYAEEILSLCKAAPIRILVRQNGFAALFKPGGTHTEALSGGGGASLEQALRADEKTAHFHLLNRLDQPTSGIVMAAESWENARLYKKHEATGQIVKTYFALVHGRLESPCTLRNLLDTANRRKTCVQNENVSNSLRWTRVAPLFYDESQDVTLVRAIIHRGARHQIRAHLAHAGYAIVGDVLYGRARGTSTADGLSGNRQGLLFLHHGRIGFPGFAAQCSPVWAENFNWDFGGE